MNKNHAIAIENLWWGMMAEQRRQILEQADRGIGSSKNIIASVIDAEQKIGGEEAVKHFLDWCRTL